MPSTCFSGFVALVVKVSDNVRETVLGSWLSVRPHSTVSGGVPTPSPEKQLPFLIAGGELGEHCATCPPASSVTVAYGLCVKGNYPSNTIVL